MNKKRKAFTIVELVIVIAVIGILSAILIPTFINLTAKANLASDETLVRNLNTSLSLEELASRDKKNITYYDAINDLKYYGYTQDNLITKSGSLLLWNEEDNRFYLSSSLKLDEIKEQHYWLLSDSFDNNYSKCKKDESTISYIDVNVSFDVGKYNNVEVLKYINNIDHSIMTNIRTNKGDTYITNMEINGHDTLYSHYGNLASLVIKDAKEYHEYGNVLDSNVTIHQGKIYIYKDSNVDKITIGNGTGDVEVITYKDVDIEVSLEDESRVTTHNYSSSETYVYNGNIETVDELTTAVSNGGKYILQNNIELSGEAIPIPADKSFELDLSGYSVIKNTEGKYVFENNDDDSVLTILDRVGGGEVNAKKGIVNNKKGTTNIINGTYIIDSNVIEANNKPIMFRCDYGSVNINGGTFDSTCIVTSNNHGIITINGGSFTTINSQPFNGYYESSHIINDCNVDSDYGIIHAFNNSTFEVNGGTFVNNITDFDYNLLPLVADYRNDGTSIGPTITVNGGTFRLESDEAYFATTQYTYDSSPSFSSTTGIHISNASITIVDSSSNQRERALALYYNGNRLNSFIEVGEGVTCNIDTNKRLKIVHSDSLEIHQEYNDDVE